MCVFFTESSITCTYPDRKKPLCSDIILHSYNKLSYTFDENLIKKSIHSIIVIFLSYSSFYPLMYFKISLLLVNNAQDLIVKQSKISVSDIHPSECVLQNHFDLVFFLN